MEVFIEKMVKKKYSARDYLIIAGIVLGVVALALLMGMFPFFTGSLIYLLIIAFAAYWGWVLASNLINVEFEYIVTNDELDIDTIINRRKRKRIFSASCKDFEIIAKKQSEYYTQNYDSIEKKIMAVTEPNATDIFFAVLNYKGARTIVYFEPDERMLEAFRNYIPKKVIV